MAEAGLAPPVGSQSLWSAIRGALGGAHFDYTTGPLGRAIVVLAVPMVLEMMMESLFGIVDVFFVARLGHDAVTTVGLTESMLAILFGVALGLSLATTAMVARRVGEKDNEGAAVAAVQSIIIGLAVSAVFGLAGFLFAPKLLALMGAPAAVIQGGAAYTRMVIGYSGVIFFLFLINGIFRGAGDPALAMRTLWLANAINLVLDPCLINGWGPFPRMGVFGAAVATTTGRGIGVAFQLWMLFSCKSRIVLGARHIRFDAEVLKRLLRVSLTGMFQFLIATASWLGLARLVSVFGSTAVAGYTIAIRMFIFFLLPPWGLCNAAATLVGQNLGAKKPERSEAAVYRTGLFNMTYLGLVSILFFTAAEPLVRIFTDEPDVVRVAVDCLRIMSIGNICYAWGMVMAQAFNGAGDTRTPTLINLCCYWLLQIPLAYWLAIHQGWGPRGVFSAVPAAEVVLAALSLLLFRRGKWKLQKI
jgi:putative MATE family efflux protein